MSDVVIKVQEVSKHYRLGEVSTGTLSHDINRWWHGIRGKEDPYLKVGEINDRMNNASKDYVWALKNLNFEVERGQILGIIGKNGAGKSTLLKLLSRTTIPTKGNIKIRGRLASLLEVGTGFHPDLSGRNNIYLNGAILGMQRGEIKKKFDEIVDFSGVGNYIDTPVKRYSSGMYVRLAFAVAAHLEPEILVVDEVLAVGDAEFQKKCLGKMKDVSTQQGRTILFVSHNMQAVANITNRCLFMKNGMLINDGPTQNILQEYFKEGNTNDIEYVNSDLSADNPTISKVSIQTTQANNVQSFNQSFEISFDIHVPKAVKAAALSYQIFNSTNNPVLHILNLSSENEFCTQPGVYNLKSTIPKLRLYPDSHYLVVHFADNHLKTKFETLESICPFEVKVFDEIRDYYWQARNAVYVEDNFWQVKFQNVINRI